MTSVYKSAAYHEDSDADDEYERSVMTSPTLPPDSESSPTSSDSPSTEHTPTTFSHPRDNVGILDWSAEQCADYVAGLGLRQYVDVFVDEAITGDALVALVHADLKEMGISSIGHRLTILKGVYDIKVKQDVPVDPDHYMPLSAEGDTADAPPTHDDIARIIRIIKDRDTEIRSLREDLSRIVEENRKLREDLLPLAKAAKDRSQPLPTPEPEGVETKSIGLSRKPSTKPVFLNWTPKNLNPSPTAAAALQEASMLDPSPATIAASNHLTTSLRDGGLALGSPSQLPQPSPTSPAYRDISAPSSTGPTSRPFPRSDASDWSTSTMSTVNAAAASVAAAAAGSITTPPTSTPSTASSTTPGSVGTPGGPQVEIFKSFRVSIDDPCYKVLPVALKKYNITADWRQYALYIVHGDQERCLGLNERPLILFKQLDKEGRKPMFMLRKHAAPVEGHVSTVGSSGPPITTSTGGGGSGRVEIPGGVL